MEHLIMTEDLSGSVRVEFREDQSDEIVIVTHMQAADLPESFEASTELDLGVGLFEVTRAQPSLHADFSRTGKLTLWIKKVERPERDRHTGDDQLFAPASRQRTLPPLSQGVSHEDADLLLMYEEDWRQNEVIATAHRALVDEQLERISHTPVGLTHVRPTIASPLADTALDLEAVCHALDASYYDGVALCTAHTEREVLGGFAVESALGTSFYGRTDEAGHITCFGVHVWEDVEGLLRDLDTLASVLPAQTLLFVSWCSASATALAECASLRARLLED